MYPLSIEMKSEQKEASGGIMNRKIAVFLTTWSEEYVWGILKGMEEKIHETGDDLFIFNNYVGYESDVDFNRCEYNIFNLPVLSEYDGALVLSNNVASSEFLGDFYEKLKASNIPTICIEQEVEGFHYIGTDNYAAMYEIVEHLVNKHRCRVFNYIGGPVNNPENAQRERAFRDVLKDNGISIDESRVRHSNFIQSGAGQEYDILASQGLEKADAVVCANDEMAIGYMQKAQEAGIIIPDEMKITGFDNTFIAKGFLPGITSVGRSKEELGRKSVEQLIEMIEGQDIPMRIYAPHEFSSNVSCGCVLSENEVEKIEKIKLEKLRHESISRWHINLMLKNLLLCNNEKELRNSLYGCSIPFNIEHFGMFVIPYDITKDISWEDTYKVYKEGYPDIMKIFAMKWYKNDNVHPLQQTRYLIPEGFSDPDKKGHLYIVSPIHMNGVNFGYLVIEDGLRFLLERNLFYAISVIDAAFETLRQNVRIRELNRQLSQMYIEDSMTGLYNRFALKMMGEPLLKDNQQKGKNTLFLFADMDGLKNINDTFGHDAGDEAIKKLGQIMNGTCPDSSYFCIRYGGDEFLMIGTCKDDISAILIQESIKEKLEVFNKARNYPYDISASMGYILALPDDENRTMDDYIKKADETMYQMKKNR